jgi:hypothetical protein
MFPPKEMMIRKIFEASARVGYMLSFGSGRSTSRRSIIWLQTLKFIYDRMLGKPKQDVSVSGTFIPAEVRDPVLLGWPKEALAKLAGRYDEAYRDVVREFGLDVAPNAPQNQIESKPAIEAESMESDRLRASS